MTIKERRTVYLLLTEVDTSTKKITKQPYYPLNNEPLRIPFFCTEYKKLRSCDECPDWNSCNEY